MTRSNFYNDKARCLNAVKQGKGSVRMEAERLETNPFQACLVDSLHYACLAKEVPEKQKEFSRSSILSACLSIEALANCCLESMALSGKLGKDFDKLTTLGKIDLYLLSRHAVTLDRGKYPVQIAEKLVSKRNDFVHPRHQKRRFHDKASEKVGVIIEMDDILEARKGTNDLIRTDAESISKKLNMFLCYFSGLAKLSLAESKPLFSEKIVFDDGKVQYQGGWTDESLRAIERLNLDMSWHPWYRSPNA
jgi:hypothetical protein